MKSLTPLLLIALSVAIFYWVTYPTYNNIQILRAETTQTESALARAKQAVAKLQEKKDQFALFSDADKQKLQVLLPDRVDNIRWIVDLTNITTRHHGKITDIRVSDDLNGPIAEVGTSDIVFKTSMTYDNFLEFLTDIQKSLKLTDVTSADFQASGPTVKGGVVDYVVNLKTYWLKK
jgi:hypothetical protein